MTTNTDKNTRFFMNAETGSVFTMEEVEAFANEAARTTAEELKALEEVYPRVLGADDSVVFDWSTDPRDDYRALLPADAVTYALQRIQPFADAADVGFYVLRAECGNPGTFDRLARTAARILSAEKLFSDPDAEDDAAALDPIDVEIFTEPRTGAFIADVAVCVGGPTVWVRYESRSGKAVIYAHWGRDALEVEVTEWQPADDLEAYAEANAAY